MPATGASIRLSLLVLVAGTGIVAYLGIRPHQPWILWLTALLTALSVDGTVRTHRLWQDQRTLSSLAYALLPGLAVLAAGFFIEETLEGYARTVAAVVAALAVGLLAYGEYQTVDFESPLYGPMRVVLAVGSYMVGFALFTVAYAADFELPLSALMVGLAAAGLAIELLRESRLIDMGALFVGLAVGISLGEFRVALYFFPLDGLLAGALLVIGFYLATGLIHHLLDRDLDIATLAEYLLVAGVGASAVVITRVVVGG